jgi:predicted nucleic acid-binding Zn ribbon protein
MRKTNEQSLGDVIRQWLKQSNIEEKIIEVRINASWGKVMGSDIQRLTERLVYRKKVLTVYLRSAPLREELSMAKTKIVQMINKEAGSHVVDEVIFR